MNPSQNPVYACERIPLRPEFASQAGALAAGQAYDNAADANAHAAEGYAGHAQFFFELSASKGAPAHLIVLYPWRSEESLGRLLESEAPLLAGWFARFADGKREVRILTNLDVEV